MLVNKLPWWPKLEGEKIPPHSLAVFLLCLLSANAPAQPVYWQPEVQALSPAIADRLPIAHPPPQPGNTGFDAWKAHWSRQSASAYWNEEASRLIVKYRLNALRANRALTLLHVAMDDAAARAQAARPDKHSQAAAAHAAAAAMLAHLFPLEPAGRLEALGQSALAALSVEQPKRHEAIALGAALGQVTAQLAIRHALDDGADEVWDVRAKPALKTAMWRATPPLQSAHPQEALAGAWRTWVLANGAEIQPPEPRLLDRQVLMQAAREVLEISRNLTPEQKRIADHWHLDQGSVTPPGLWNRKAIALADSRKLDERTRLRMHAAINVAMLDASIACWQAKYTWWVQRPVTVIQEHLDASFMPYLVTPTHPSYVSGHASASGAAAEVLKAFFPKDARRIDAWAAEAAVSRLYGGIHYREDNDAGLELGRRVGRRVVEERLAVTPSKNRVNVSRP